MLTNRKLNLLISVRGLGIVAGGLLLKSAAGEISYFLGSTFCLCYVDIRIDNMKDVI